MQSDAPAIQYAREYSIRHHMMQFCLPVSVLYILCTSFVFVVMMIIRNRLFVKSFVLIAGDNLRLSPA